MTNFAWALIFFLDSGDKPRPGCIRVEPKLHILRRLFRIIYFECVIAFFPFVSWFLTNFAEYKTFEIFFVVHFDSVSYRNVKKSAKEHRVNVCRRRDAGVDVFIYDVSSRSRPILLKVCRPMLTFLG